MSNSKKSANQISPMPFPADHVRKILEREIREAAEESLDIRGGWEPQLDSLRIVSILVSVEDIFDFPLPPEELVQRGGYETEEQAVSDVMNRLEKLFNEKSTCGAQA